MREKIESYLCMNIAIAMFSITCMFMSIAQRQEIAQIKKDAEEVVLFITSQE